jgi:hypothetical protein
LRAPYGSSVILVRFRSNQVWGIAMRPRAVVVFACVLTAGVFAALAPVASASPHAKVPPVCVHHALPQHLNVQVGYCP